ncbi:unnamed protein product, partial [marine sediment metagenome]
LDIDHIRQQRQRQRNGQLFGFSQPHCEFQDSDNNGSWEKSHGDPGGSILHLLYFTNKQAIYVLWRNRQYQCEFADRLYLDCFGERNLDIDHIRQQRQRQRNGQLFGFSQPHCEFQDSDNNGSWEKSHGDPGGSILHLLYFTNKQAIYVLWRNRQYQCEFADRLYLDCFGERNLDIDHIRQQR